MRPVACAVVALLLGASLVGCGGGGGNAGGGGGGGGSDTPAVCASVDTLKTSVDKLKDVDVTSSSGVSDLKSGLAGIQTDLGDVKTDAKSEFSPQIDAAEKSYEALKTSVTAAADDRSAATLAAAGSALAAFRTDLNKLVSDVESTC